MRLHIFAFVGILFYIIDAAKGYDEAGAYAAPYPCTKGFHPLDSNSGNSLVW